jgi:hypothetical protein
MRNENMEVSGIRFIAFFLTMHRFFFRWEKKRATAPLTCSEVVDPRDTAEAPPYLAGAET